MRNHDKHPFHTYCFFKTSHRKVYEAYPKYFSGQNFREFLPISPQIRLFQQIEKNTMPISFLAKRPRIGTMEKNHIQSSSSQFRTVLFICSESGTFLKNYIICYFPHINLHKKIACRCLAKIKQHFKAFPENAVFYRSLRESNSQLVLRRHLLYPFN